jgi:Antibiotic biosynthesis monooxygenase
LPIEEYLTRIGQTKCIFPGSSGWHCFRYVMEALTLSLGFINSQIMTTIESGKKICTLINVFSVDPEKHEELFELLRTASENVMSKLPGYISANLPSAMTKKQLRIMHNGNRWPISSEY